MARARVHATTVGFGEYWLNGARIGTDVLHPAQTDENSRVLFSTYDVTRLLRDGENVLGAVVAPSWSGERAVIAQLDITQENGSRTRVATGRRRPDDPIWTVAAGPVVQAAIFDGETYDARITHHGWTVPGAAPWGTMRELGHAHASSRSTGTLHPHLLEPIRVVETIHPVPVERSAGRTRVFDAGRNVAGWARIRVRGEAGQTVVLRFSETLHGDGTLNQGSLRSAQARDEYILSGADEEVWEPSFTCHGFRFVEVVTPAEILGVDVRVVRSDIARRSDFRCSDSTVQAIDAMVRRTEEANLGGIPTDCPQRDERMGWLNDMTARSEELVYNVHSHRLLSKWMNDIADTQRADGAIADTAPFRLGVRPADPVAMCYLLIPWLLRAHFGDQVTMERHFEGMRRWVEYLDGLLVDDILLLSHYGDWAPPASASLGGEIGGSALSAATPGELVSTAHYAGSLDLLIAAADVLGVESEPYRQRRVAVARAFHERFWTGQGYGSGNQASHSIALYFRLVPDEFIAQAVSTLVDAVQRADHHLTTGNLATKYLLEVLCEYGHVDQAFAIVSQRTYPSWGFMLENGATTIWERWEHLTDGGMNSHNHPMYASVGAWLHRRLAGVRLSPGANAFSDVIIDPCVPTALSSAASTIQTVRGRLRCGWQHDDGAVRLSLDLPPGCRAEVRVPGSEPMIGVTGSQVFSWDVRRQP